MNIRNKPGVRWVPFLVLPNTLCNGYIILRKGYLLRKGITIDGNYIHPTKKSAISECLRRNNNLFNSETGESNVSK